MLQITILVPAASLFHTLTCSDKARIDMNDSARRYATELERRVQRRFGEVEIHVAIVSGEKWERRIRADSWWQKVTASAIVEEIETDLYEQPEFWMRPLDLPV